MKLFELNSSGDGSQRKKAILDINVIYSALHKFLGVCGRIVMLGAEASVDLYSIDLAREELRVNLERKMSLNRDEIELIIYGLQIQWIPSEAYVHQLKIAIRIVGN